MAKKDKEPRSWSGYTAAELADGAGGEGGGACPHPMGSRIERNRENAGKRKIRINYTCQACGTDFSITKNV